LEVATDPCDDFSKTVQNTPFKKSSLNQQYREVVVTAAATRSLHTLVATITHNPPKAKKPMQKNLHPV